MIFINVENVSKINFKEQKELSRKMNLPECTIFQNDKCQKESIFQQTCVDVVKQRILVTNKFGDFLLF
jgi:hypothetical protein